MTERVPFPDAAVIMRFGDDPGEVSDIDARFGSGIGVRDRVLASQHDADAHDLVDEELLQSPGAHGALQRNSVSGKHPGYCIDFCRDLILGGSAPCQAHQGYGGEMPPGKARPGNRNEAFDRYPVGKSADDGVGLSTQIPPEEPVFGAAASGPAVDPYGRAAFGKECGDEGDEIPQGRIEKGQRVPRPVDISLYEGLHGEHMGNLSSKQETV